MQHHGFFIFNQADLSFYPQSLYPKILFKNSVNLMDKDSQLLYQFRGDYIEKRLALYNNLYSLVNYTKREKEVYFNLATLKSFISNITLLPVLYIQLKKGYIYKRDAFEQLSDYFNDILIFKKAEKLRSDFPYKRKIKYFPFFLHPCLIPILHCKLYKDNISSNAEELQALTRFFLKSFIDKLYHEGI